MSIVEWRRKWISQVLLGRQSIEVYPPSHASSLKLIWVDAYIKSTKSGKHPKRNPVKLRPLKNKNYPDVKHRSRPQKVSQLLFLFWIMFIFVYSMCNPLNVYTNDPEKPLFCEKIYCINWMHYYYVLPDSIPPVLHDVDRIICWSPMSAIKESIPNNWFQRYTFWKWNLKLFNNYY